MRTCLCFIHTRSRLCVLVQKHIYVCARAHLCMCVNSHLYACVCALVCYVCAHLCAQVCVYVRLRVRMRTFLRVRVSGFELVFVPVHVCGFPKQDGQNIGEFIGGDSKSSDRASVIQLNCRSPGRQPGLTGSVLCPLSCRCRCPHFKEGLKPFHYHWRARPPAGFKFEDQPVLPIIHSAGAGESSDPRSPLKVQNTAPTISAGAPGTWHSTAVPLSSRCS